MAAQVAAEGVRAREPLGKRRRYSHIARRVFAMSPIARYEIATNAHSGSVRAWLSAARKRARNCGLFDAVTACAVVMGRSL
jgi:hypothetical protein